MKIPLKAAERLIIAADFNPTGDGRESAREVVGQVLELALALEGTGVCLKVNSALRIAGYALIDDIRVRSGLQVFADLKLCDIKNTMETDGKLLRAFKPDLLTVACSVGRSGLTALQQMLPNTEVLGVTVLTSLNSDDVKAIHGGLTLNAAATNLATLAMNAGLGGLICSPAEAAMLRKLVGDGMTINTPGVRPKWAEVSKDDQNAACVMTPGDAIRPERTGS